MEWTPATIATVAGTLGSVGGALLTVLFTKGGPVLLQLLNIRAKNKRVEAKMAAEGYEKFIARLYREMKTMKRELAKVRDDHTECQVEQASLKSTVATQAEKIARLEKMASTTAIVHQTEGPRD